MLITPPQFEEVFLPHLGGGCTTYQSPHLSFMVRRFGVSTSTDTIIADLLEYQHNVLKEIESSLPDGGKFIGRFPIEFVVRVINKGTSDSTFYTHSNLNITDIVMDDSSAIVYLTKEAYAGSTVVTYSGNKSIDIDITKCFVLKSYNKRHYDYINSFDQSVSFDRIPIAGRKGDFARKVDGIDITNCVFFSAFSTRPTIKSIVDVNTELSCDMFILNNTKEVKYYSELMNKDILEFIDNLCYGKHTSLKASHKNFIVNPQITNL